MIQPKISSGVTFDPDVVDYLRGLCAEFQRDRSFVINAIVREHAQRHEPRPQEPERAIHY